MNRPFKLLTFGMAWLNGITVPRYLPTYLPTYLGDFGETDI